MSETGVSSTSSGSIALGVLILAAMFAGAISVAIGLAVLVRPQLGAWIGEMERPERLGRESSRRARYLVICGATVFIAANALAWSAELLS